MNNILRNITVITALMLMAAAMQTVSAEEPAATKAVLDTTKIWVNYNYALIPMEKTKVSMNALITYIKDTLGKDTAKLETYRDDFISKQANLKTTAQNNQPLGQTISEMKHIAINFRDEARTLVGENKTGALLVVKQALEENKPAFCTLTADARSTHKQHNLEAFDYINGKAQSKLDEGKAKGYDITELQAALDGIKEKRQEVTRVMDDAIESCKTRCARFCNTTQTEEYFKARDDIIKEYKDLRDLAKNAGKSIRVSNAIAQARKIIETAQSTLDRAESSNIDVSREKANLDEISNLVDSAEEKNKNGDYDGAISDLKSAQDAFKDLRESVKTRRGKR